MEVNCISNTLSFPPYLASLSRTTKLPVLVECAMHDVLTYNYVESWYVNYNDAWLETNIDSVDMKTNRNDIMLYETLCTAQLSYSKHWVVYQLSITWLYPGHQLFY